MLVLLLRPESSSFKRNQTPIANLSKIKFEVKRKFLENLSWELIQKNSIVFQGDEIFTGENAEANIVFIKSKTSIIIPPKSLVKIEVYENVEAIEIKEGLAEVQINEKGKLKIKNGDKLFEVTASMKSKLTLSKQFGELSIAATEGSIAVKNELKTIELNQDNALKMDENLSTVNIQIIFPKPSQKIDSWTSKVNLKLKQPIKGNVIISKDSSFETIVINKTLDNVSELGLEELLEGIYFLKVTSSDESSEIRTFEIINSFSFTPKSPLDGETSSLQFINDSVRLSWKNVNKDATFEIELNNEEVVQIFKIKKGTTFLDVKNLTGKSFSWKGKTIYKEKSTSFSNPNFVQLDFNRPLSLLNESTSKINSSDKNSVIKWKKVAKNEKFNILITKEEKNIINTVIDDDYWNLNKLERGRYVVKISSLTYPGKNNFLSKEISIISPILEWDAKLPPSYASLDPTLTIDLKYQAEKNADIKLLLQTETDKTFLPISISNDKLTLNTFGSYCLKATGDDVKSLSESLPYCFEYKSLPAFSALPKVADQIMNYVRYKDQDAYQIKVPTVARAVKYIFTIFKDKEATQKVFEGESKTPDIYWMRDDVGIYYLKYKVFDEKDRTSSHSPISRIMFPISPDSDWNN